MTEVTKAVLSGVLILVVGQLIQKSFLEPIQELRMLIGEIGAALIFYGNVTSDVVPHYFANLQKLEKLQDPSNKLSIERYETLIRDSWVKCDEAQVSLRKQASQLTGKANVIPFYRMFATFGLLPKQKNLILASQQLIGLSNSMHSENEGVTEKISTIKKSLRMMRL